MKIGIIGAGHVGKALLGALSKAGHDVKVANSRGPESIPSEALAEGGRAVTVTEAVVDVEALIISIPLGAIPSIASLIATVPSETVVIDTSNYYPGRDKKIEDVEAGKAESIWVSEQLGRPIAKAWNAIFADSLARHGLPAGAPGRIAIPVAADRERDRVVAVALVEDTGLDAIFSGSLADSWRQQPGAPSYCTNFNRDELPGALASAEKSRLPARRDLAVAAFMERMSGPVTNPNADFGVRLSRALFV